MTTIESTLLPALRDGRLPCAFAFHLADKHGWTADEIGAEATRLDVRISRCQLGLFGYDSFRQKGFVQQMAEVPGGGAWGRNRIASRSGSRYSDCLCGVVANRRRTRVAADRHCLCCRNARAPCVTVPVGLLLGKMRVRFF